VVSPWTSEIRNIDQYLATFTGQLPPLDASDLPWFVACLDRIRRRFFHTTDHSRC
jgi:hypothetical protein